MRGREADKTRIRYDVKRRRWEEEKGGEEDEKRGEETIEIEFYSYNYLNVLGNI